MTEYTIEQVALEVVCTKEPVFILNTTDNTKPEWLEVLSFGYGQDERAIFYTEGDVAHVWDEIELLKF